MADRSMTSSVTTSMTFREMNEEEERLTTCLARKRQRIRELMAEQDRELHHVVALQSQLDALKRAREEKMLAAAIAEDRVAVRRQKRRDRILAAVVKRMPPTSVIAAVKTER